MPVIVSIKSGAVEELKRIELSDGSSFSFKTCYLPALNEGCFYPLVEGGEISPAEAEGFRFASACLRAEMAALRLIARAEQCTFGLERKLERRGYKPACISAAISRLLQLGLVDDKRFARLWLESKLHIAQSPRRLLISLCTRGISHSDAQTAIKAVLDEERELVILRRFAEKQKKRGKDTRQLKYLLKSEGFSTAAIHSYLEI